MFDETIKHIWSVFGDQKFSTKEAEARLTKLFDNHCPDDFVKTMIKFKQRGLIKGEVSSVKGGWVWWVDDECKSVDFTKVK